MTKDQLQQILGMFEANFPGHQYAVELNAKLRPGIRGEVDFSQSPLALKVGGNLDEPMEREILLHELAHVAAGLDAKHGLKFRRVLRHLRRQSALQDMLAYLNGQEASQ